MSCQKSSLSTRRATTSVSALQSASWLYAELEDAVRTHSITRLTDLLDPIAADTPALGAQLRGLTERYDILVVKAILEEIKTP